MPWTAKKEGSVIFLINIQLRNSNEVVGTLIVHDKIVGPHSVQQHNTYAPPHGKTNNLHRRKQRRRSASR